jgi:diguanylate cyclase (GGDEF)-like protein
VSEAKAIPRFRVGQLVLLTALAAVYFAAGKLGLRLAFVNASTSAVWPPAGIALAAFLIFGRRVWPAVLLGAFLVNLTTDGSVPASIGIAIASLLGGLAGAKLCERFAGGRHAFEDARSVLLFALLAAGLSSTISATLGVVTLAVTHQAEWQDFGPIWLTWWLGDAGGDLVVAPLILLWAGDLKPHFKRSQWFEAAALMAAVVVVGELVFGESMPTALAFLPLEYLYMPVLVWAAFRFGQRAVAVVVVLTYFVAVQGTLDEVGPFVRDERNVSLLLLQGFTAVAATTSMMLAAVVSERRRSEARLAHLAISDELTGLGNYRHLIATLEREIQRSERTGRSFVVLFLDMDGLKGVNDEFGHLTGSRALARLGDALRKACRAMDTAARYGGDEFLVVLPEADLAAAEQVSQRVNELLLADTEEPRISVSTGAAQYPRDGRTISELLGAADKAQYAVKTRRSPPLGAQRVSRV